MLKIACRGKTLKQPLFPKSGTIHSFIQFSCFFFIFRHIYIIEQKYLSHLLIKASKQQKQIGHDRPSAAQFKRATRHFHQSCILQTSFIQQPSFRGGRKKESR